MAGAISVDGGPDPRPAPDDWLTGVAEIDPQGRITRANDDICALLGRHRATLIGANFADILCPEGVDVAIRHHQRQVQGEIDRYRVDTRCFHRDGSILQISCTSTAVRDEQGHLLHAVVVVEDNDHRFGRQSGIDGSGGYAALFDVLPAAIYTTDAAGRITYYNEAASTLWGCRPELGSAQWCGSWRLYWLDGTPMPHDESPMAIALRDGRAVRGYQLIAERPDGTHVPFIPFPTPLRDAVGRVIGAINMLLDVSERQQAERALRDREEHYRHMVELNPQVLWTADSQGRLGDFSDRWLEWTGLTREQATTQGWATASHPDDLPPISRRWRHAVRNGEPFDAEHRIRTSDGDFRWVHSRAYPRFDAQGRVTCWYGTTADIHERGDLRRNQLATKLERASRLSAMGQVAANLAHELAQPLAAAVAYLDGSEALLRTSNAPLDEPLYGLGEARKQIMHASDIVGRLRRFIRRRPSDRQLADLNHLVTEAVELATAGTAERTGLCVRYDFAAALPPVLVDAVEFQRVVVNLVRNAIEAMAGCDRRELRIATALTDDTPLLLVSDTGPGLAIGRDELFEPFVTTKPDGLGLGLAICQAIVERFDGRIWAGDNDGGGTTFYVAVPAASGQ